MASRIIPRTAVAATRRRVVAGPSLIRRGAATAAHEDVTKPKPVFDPVLAGASAVVFGSLAFYLLSSDGKKSDHDSHGYSSSKRKDLDWEYKRMAGEGHSKAGEESQPGDKNTNPAYNTGSSAGGSSVLAASSNSGSSAEDGVADSVKSSIVRHGPLFSLRD
ncbi:hypothetical protein FRC01_010137 [Tulasnella sp. 417]|nr:hypothetical protein FRC01_010137 [Tulasnella sp. 417]